MASNHTSAFQLCQWMPGDKVLRTEFNENSAKIDFALYTLTEAVNKAATRDALNSLERTVATMDYGKADKSALDSLSATVSQHTAALAGKGNCLIYATRYYGTGKYGADNPCWLTYAQTPMVIFVTGPEGYQGIFTYPVTRHYAGRFGGVGNYVDLTWSNGRVEWYSEQSASIQLNTKDQVYYVVALLQAG